jgi:hypothetical protein
MKCYLDDVEHLVEKDTVVVIDFSLPAALK